MPVRSHNARRHPPPLPGHSLGASCPPAVRQPPAITVTYFAYPPWCGFLQLHCVSLSVICSLDCSLCCGFLQLHCVSLSVVLLLPGGQFGHQMPSLIPLPSAIIFAPTTDLATTPSRWEATRPWGATIPLRALRYSTCAQLIVRFFVRLFRTTSYQPCLRLMLLQGW